MITGFKSFKNVLARRIQDGQDLPTISVALAEDSEVLATIKQVIEEGLAKAILVGNEDNIKALIEEASLESALGTFIAIENVQGEKEAADRAVDLIAEGRCQMLMKGLVNSSIFLRAIIDGEKRAGRKGFLSHLAAMQVPGFDRLLFITDAGMNVAPDLEGKEKILNNALSALHKLGIAEPKVAMAGANEKVDPRIPAAVHAETIAKKWAEGEFPGSVIEGPVAMDVALSREAAEHKGISSKIAGETDLFIMPDIQAGNMVSKTMIYCAGAIMAGVVLGTPYPVVMTSRAESAEGKKNSILMAAVLAGK